MPTSVGPNTFGEENLVFGYDLGDVSNSYKGEPVTNIWGVQTGFNVNQRSGWDMPYAYNGAITNSVYTGGTWNGNRIWEVLHTAGTSGYAGYESWRLCVDQPLAGTGTYSTTRRVAIKICVLEGSITDMALHSGGGNSSYDSSNWTPIPESQVPRDCPVKTGWYQFLADGSWNSDSVGHCVGLGFISYNRVKILTTEPMYYPSNHLIPFTGLSRSASGSLADLTGNSTIDLSNVSFDSNAQMEFDGSDDYITLPHANSPITNLTYELVARIDSIPASNTFRSIWQKSANWNGDTGISMQMIYGNLTFSYGNTWGGTVQYPLSNLTASNWYHIVGTADSTAGNDVRFYVNGTLVDTGTSYQTPTTTSDLTIGLGNGGSFDGPISIFKMYSRALTASEVKSNYNTIKGRFNI